MLYAWITYPLPQSEWHKICIVAKYVFMELEFSLMEFIQLPEFLEILVAPMSLMATDENEPMVLQQKALDNVQILCQELRSLPSCSSCLLIRRHLENTSQDAQFVRI